MAKRDRIVQSLECQECKRKNYTYRRNRSHKQEKLQIKKFCKYCGSHTKHKTVKG